MRHPFHPRRYFVLFACASFTLSGSRAWGDGSDGIPSRSTNIALTSDERKLLSVNVDTNSVTLFRVKDASDETELIKLKEIPVGREPHGIAVHPDDSVAFVTNSASGTVSVIDLEDDAAKGVVGEIPVGTEPRGCALTPNGRLLYVANHTEGTVSIINTHSRTVVGTVFVGRNPTAVAVTNNGDRDDLDERVFVTQIFAELVPNGPGEGRNLGKQG